MSQSVLFDHALPKQKLPTNLTTKNHAVHRWFNFIAGFSPEFVSDWIDDSGVKATDGLLIDPFAGMSTALVQANLDGVRSVGYEPHPFFYDISLAKLNSSESQTVDMIERVCLSLRPVSEELSFVWSLDAIKFLAKLVPDTELKLLAAAVQAEHQIPVNSRPMFRLVVSPCLGGNDTVTDRRNIQGTHQCQTVKRVP